MLKRGVPTATLVLLLILYGLPALSQIRVRGKVSHAKDNSGLPGVTVVAKKLKKGTTTDAQGNFELNLPKGTHKISFSFIGFRTYSKKVTVKNKPVSLNISLKESTTTIGEVVVRGKSEARQIREQAMPISVISMDEIAGTVSDVSDVLTKTAGIKIRSTGGVGSAAKISVRGLEGKRIAFFIDEIPIANNTDFMDINDIPTDLIERIEVYKGIVPARLGGSAIGGAVNIVLKEYPPHYADLSYGYHSFNTHKVSSVFNRNRNGYEYGIGGFYTYADNDYTMELPNREGEKRTRNHDLFEKAVLGGGFTSKKWWFDETVFEPALIFSRKEIQGIETKDFRETQNTTHALALVNHSEKTDCFTEGLDLDLMTVYGFSLNEYRDRGKFSYGWDDEIIKSDNQVLGGEEGRQPNDSYNKKHTFYQKTNLNYVLNKRNSINLNSVYNFAKGIPQDELKDEVLTYKTNFDSWMNSWVIGLAHEFYSPDKKFTNQLTLKYYFYSMETTLVDLFGQGTKEAVNMNKSDYGINDAIRFRLTPSFLLKTSLGYDVRLPDENELLGDGFIIAPAGNLEPERNTSFNFGFMYNKTSQSNRNFQIEANVFYMYLENMIRITGGPLQSIYQNFGKMREYGAELEVKWDATDIIYLWGNATYLDQRDAREFEPNSSVPNPTKGDRMPNKPWFYANIGVEVHKENIFGGTGQNTRLFVDCSFVEEYFYDFEQSVYQERRIPRAITFDAGLVHSLMNERMFISLKAYNFTDAKILSEFNRPLPGRNFGVKVRYIFK